MNNLKKQTLLKNTVMLYILQFSTYFFSFLTVPYQSRVLEPVVYGKLGFAIAVMSYVQLFMDFGFMLSATADISKNRNDKAYINRRLSSITVLKLILSAISFFAIGVLCGTVQIFSEDPMLYILYVCAYAINAFLPDFIYRGIEQMTSITVRTVVIKLFFTAMIFLLLKSPSDYLIVPILLLIGNALAVISSYIHLFRTLGYSFGKITRSDLRSDFFKSLTFFFSRIATTVYSTTNTVILGAISSLGDVTGYYTSADKVLSTAKNGLSPISDSLYPYMVKNKDFKLVKKILVLLMPVIVLGCAIVGIFAKPICVFVFGSDYEGVAPILTAMLPAIVAILPSYILGFPTLSAMGLAKHANYSIIAGTVTHIIGLSILGICGHLSAVTLAAMTSVSEWSILIFRLVVVIKNKNLFYSKS